MELMTIPEAAAKYGIDVKRLRGAVWRENCTGDIRLPVGSYETDQVYDGDLLRGMGREATQELILRGSMAF